MQLGHPFPSRLKLASPLLSSSNISSITTHAPFDLLHCDIWGPHKVPTHSGARFFLTIVDDFTRCTINITLNLSSSHLLLLFVLNFIQPLKLSGSIMGLNFYS